MTTDMACTARSFLLRLASGAALVLCFTLSLRAGGPKRVAGPDYFDAGVTGQPLVWPQGSIVFYTDQGDLSSALPNASANTFVANAFRQWSAVSTAALTASSGGQLAEDVNGTNVYLNSDGSISMPADIQALATGTPVGVVYDADGSVTDALIGAGAGDSSQCFWNAVYGGADDFGTFATYQHALIVINGQCAQQSSQLTDVEYRLVRVIGEVLGVGWSQLNLNVQTGSPQATSDDYLGFPIMHFTDSIACVPITLCFANPYQLSADDVAAVSRLYPVTAQNQSQFPGKQIFAATTAGIHGSVWFTDTHGNRTQPMQGVNVVARLLDPKSGTPSRRYAVSSVSGFLFTGNEGNPITGIDDAIGDPLNDWGSESQVLEGYFNLAGLPLPNGSSAQYQLSVEAIDPQWSTDVGPYSPGPVSPSGTMQPITVNVSAGGDVQQDILMSGSAQPLSQIPPTSWTSPAALPRGGDWISALGDYDEVDYFLLPAQSNRTLSVAVTALDESGRPSQLKAQPVIGMWAASDPQGTAPGAFTSSPFNSILAGMTRLDAQLSASENFLIAISDVRGDGRADYRYHARVLYADTVTPSRIGANGGPVTVQGIGFAPGLVASAGGTAAAQLAVSATQMILAVPAHADGPQKITITDPLSGASTSMTGALTYGASATDQILLLSTTNPNTAVGATAAAPMQVRVVAADGVTPVSGATVGWSATNGVQLSACNAASSCSATTDQSGIAATWLNPTAPGVATITATLAPGVYTPAQSVNETLNATETASDIGVLSPYLWISQGATVSIPLKARVLSNGVPQSGVTVNFQISHGSGTLTASSATTNSSGYATSNLAVSQFTGVTQASACVAPANAPCGVFYANAVAPANQQLLQISGAGQIVAGSSLQPVVVRVVDNSSPPNAVIGSPAVFQITVLRPGGESSGSGEGNSGNPAMPVILSVTQTTLVSDGNGYASIVPAARSFSPPLEVDVGVTAGSGASLDVPLFLLPGKVNSSGAGSPQVPVRAPVKLPPRGEDLR